MVSKLPAPHDFRKLLPTTPHDLAICVGWWTYIGFVLFTTVVSVCVMGWLGLVNLAWFCSAANNAWLYFLAAQVDIGVRRKYAAGGVQLQGRVVKRWEVDHGEGGISKHIRVLYQVGEARYNKNFEFWPGQDHDDELNNAVDLVVLPGYPKSAILYAPIKKMDGTLPPVDPDFVDSPVYSYNALGVHLLFILCVFTMAPPGLVWTDEFVDGVGVAGKVLYGINLVVMIVLVFVGAYKISIRDRDWQFHEFVYGAEPADADLVPLVSSSSSSGNTSLEEKGEEDHVLSYEEFCQRHHLPQQYRPSYQTVLQISVWGVLWCVYYVAFLGCFLMWYSLTVPIWKRRLFRRYESESDISSIVGSVTCKSYQGTGMGIVIVLYKANNNNNNNNQFYKKRLHILWKSINELESFPDGLELVYLKGSPESAICKKYTLLDQDYAKIEMWRTRMFVWGLFIMTLQIGIPIATFVPNSLCYYFLVVQFVMGFVGVLIRYQIVIPWEILDGGARQVAVEDQTSDNSRSTTTDGSFMGNKTTSSNSEITMLPLSPDEKAVAPTADTGV